MYLMMVGDTPFHVPATAIFVDEYYTESVQFPPYLTKNAVSILNGVSVITVKTEALGVLNILLNAVFFRSWDTDCIAIKWILRMFVVVDVGKNMTVLDICVLSAILVYVTHCAT